MRSNIQEVMDRYRRPEPRSQKEAAYVAIKRKILSGRVRPGEWLAESAEAEALGIGRTPVREALIELEHENLVIIAPRKGVLVAPISVEDIRDVYEMREVLDCLAVRLAVGRVPEDELSSFEDLFRELLNHPSYEPAEDLLEVDRAFHDLVMRCSGNRWLMDIAGLLLDRSQLIRVISHKHPGRMEESWHEHLGLIEAIRGNDAAAAERWALVHVANARESVIQSIMP